MGKEKINIGLILIIISIVLIASGCILLTQSDMFKDKNNENHNGINNNTEIDSNLYIKFGGRYINEEDDHLNIYVLDEKNIYYVIAKEDGFLSNIAKINLTTASDDAVEISLNTRDNSLKLSLKESSISIKSNEFKRIDDYTAENFYKDNIGDLTYISEKINGIYEKENNSDIEMTIFTSGENRIKFSIKNNSNVYEDYLSLENDDMYISDEGEEIYSKIVVNNDKIIFSQNSDTYIDFNGNYIKKKDIDLDSIIKEYIGFSE